MPGSRLGVPVGKMLRKRRRLGRGRKEGEKGAACLGPQSRASVSLSGPSLEGNELGKPRGLCKRLPRVPRAPKSREIRLAQWGAEIHLAPTWPPSSSLPGTHGCLENSKSSRCITLPCLHALRICMYMQMNCFK